VDGYLAHFWSAGRATKRGKSAVVALLEGYLLKRNKTTPGS
jgi:hypothetical protein